MKLIIERFRQIPLPKEEIAAGYHNRSKVTKVKCKRCYITILRKSKGKHHDIIEE